MKFKVYKSTREKEIKELHFKLEETNNNTVRLFIVDENGFDIPYGDILEISSNGVHMFSRVNNVIGLPLDHKRHVAVTLG